MKKPAVEIVRNHRRAKTITEPIDKRTLELRVTHNRIPRYFATNGTIQLTAEEFQNKHLKKNKEAYEEIRADYNAAIEIIGKLGDSFSFAYYTALNWLVKFKDRITLDEITGEMLSRLDAFMHRYRPDISQNTVNMYFRSIRAVYNYAVEKGYIDDKTPRDTRFNLSYRLGDATHHEIWERE